MQSGWRTSSSCSGTRRPLHQGAVPLRPAGARIRPVAPRAAAADAGYPLLILPGFGNNSSDYLAPFGREEDGIAAHLQARGQSVHVVQVERKDWIKVARNLLTLGFWKSSLTTDPGYTWYLQRLHAAVLAAREATGADKVHLVGHSAGGWLARAYLADPAFNSPEAIANGEPNPAVASLTSLGTPHIPPCSTKARDMTGGALTWLHNTYPGAYWTEAGVRYVCVAGKAVVGDKDAPKDTVARYAYSSYQQVTGDGHQVVGDAVVPCDSCLLHGAATVILDNVYHSMARFGTFDERHEGADWYGSDAIIDTWLPHTLGAAAPESAEAAMVQVPSQVLG